MTSLVAGSVRPPRSRPPQPGIRLRLPVPLTNRLSGPDQQPLRDRHDGHQSDKYSGRTLATIRTTLSRLRRVSCLLRVPRLHLPLTVSETLGRIGVAGVRQERDVCRTVASRAVRRPAATQDAAIPAIKATDGDCPARVLDRYSGWG